MPYELLIPAVILVSSILLGISIEKLFNSKLTKIAKRSSFKTDDIIISAFKGMILLWFALAGIYISLFMLFGNTLWMGHIVKIVVSLVIISVTIVLMRAAAGLINLYSQKADGLLPSISLFANLTRITVAVLGILVMLQYLGISITPVLTALGVGGLAVALALQDTLANIFAGIAILFSRQIKPGDYIKLDSGEEGFITDINWRNTSIRMMSNNTVLIPNSKLSSAVVTNHELPEHEMSVLVNVGISYSSELEAVESIVCEVAKEVMQEVRGGVPEFEPYIRYHTFADSSIEFTAILKVSSFTDQYLIKHEFIKRLHSRFNKEGIEIPFPIRTVYLQNADEAIKSDPSCNPSGNTM